MRLTSNQVQVIKETILAVDPRAEIFLFGSRTDDSKRGGDIDLLIKSTIINLDNRRKIKLRLLDKLGAQKIDLVLAKDDSTSFVKIVKKEGLRL